MNIKFNKTEILDALESIKTDFEEDGAFTYSGGEDGTAIDENEYKSKVQEAIDFVQGLTEEKIKESAKGMVLKKNGKPRKGAIANLFVGDTGYWFVEWYVTYRTFKIVSRALDENTIEVSLEYVNINAGEYPCIAAI